MVQTQIWQQPKTGQLNFVLLYVVFPHCTGILDKKSESAAEALFRVSLICLEIYFGGDRGEEVETHRVEILGEGNVLGNINQRSR